MPSNYEIMSEAVKYVATGLLGVLWWDIRKVHGLKERIMNEVNQLLEKHDRQSKAEIKGEYLTIESHNQLCENMALRMENSNLTQTKEMKSYMDGVVKDIVSTIRANGAKGH